MTGLAQPLDDSPQLLDAAAVQRITLRLAHEIAERHPMLDGVVLVGIPTRGVPLARAVARQLAGLGHTAPPVAALDPSAHRDDRPRPAVAHPALHDVDGGPAPRIDGSVVIVVDDVLFTGRTLRAALDALVDCGRPAAVEVLDPHRSRPSRAAVARHVRRQERADGDRRPCLRAPARGGRRRRRVAAPGRAVNAILRGVRVIDPLGRLDAAGQDVWIDGGKILAIYHHIDAAGVPVVDLTPQNGADPCVLCPGFIDLHAHLRQPGDDEAETLESGSRAAAAGGFTHVVAMANTVPPIDTPERVAEARLAASNLPVSILQVAALTRGLEGAELVDIRKCIEAGAVARRRRRTQRRVAAPARDRARGDRASLARGVRAPRGRGDDRAGERNAGPGDAQPDTPRRRPRHAR